MTIEYSSGPTVMMMLGTFQFGIATAAYQELSRSQEWRWPSQDRFQQLPVLQFTGPGSHTITLPGVIYPEYRGGFGQLDEMRSMADAGEPMTLIDGSGTIMGRWVIERLDERQAVFAAAGRPRKQEFTLNLRMFDDLDVGMVSQAFLDAQAAAQAAASPAADAVPSDPNGVAGMLKSAASTVAGIADSISGAVSSVTAVAADLAGMASSVLAPVQGALRTANTLMNSVNDAQRLLGFKPTKISALASLGKVVNSSTSAVANVSQLSRTLGRVSRDLSALGTVPQHAIKTVQDAHTTVNKLAVYSTSLQTRASQAADNIETMTA